MTDAPPLPIEDVADAIALFVDCNCFLQLRDLKDLPWRELIPGIKHVEIMVVPSVIAELDHKKVDFKERIRNRARAAIRLVDTASETDPMRLVLRNDPIVVALNLPEIAPIAWSNHPKLDPTRPDDQLVAQALEARNALPKLLLSHDAGPRITARRCGLPSKTVPADWLLPDPVDEDRKTIQRLQRENELLKASRPEIVAHWSSELGSPEKLTVQRLILPPLGGEAILALAAKCASRWPHAVGTMRMAQGFFIGDDDTSGRFDQGDYERYVAKWQKWRDGLVDFFEKLDRKIAAVSRIAAAEFEYENAGGATAERLTIAFEVTEGWRVFAEEKDVEGVVPLPIKIPVAPLTPFRQDQQSRAKEADDVTRQIEYMLPRPDVPRDPTAFFWIDRPGYDSRFGKFECAEFRPKRTEAEAIWLRAEASAPHDGQLTIDIHGKNLSAPLLLRMPLTFEDRVTDWSDPKVAAILDAGLAALINEVVAGPKADE